MNSRQQPTVLILGATGNTGRLIAQELERDPGEDLAAVAAAALREGPGRRGGQELQAEFRSPEDMAKMLGETGDMEEKDVEGAVELMHQVADGRTGGIGSVRETVPHVIGRPATGLRAWAGENRAALLAASQ